MSIVTLEKLNNSLNEKLVEKLEYALEEAKKGELLGAVFLYQWKGDLVGSDWALTELNARRLLGEIEVLKRDLLEKIK